MPFLSVTKIMFHAESQTFSAEFCDYSRRSGITLTVLAQAESWEWAAAQVAVKCPDTWIQVT